MEEAISLSHRKGSKTRFSGLGQGHSAGKMLSFMASRILLKISQRHFLSDSFPAKAKTITES